MTEEQEAIAYFEGKMLEEGDNITITFDFIENLETVLNMLKEKDKEIEKPKADNKKAWKLNANMSQRHLSDIFKIKKKDKIIDLMAEQIKIPEPTMKIESFDIKPKTKFSMRYLNKEEVKQYFKEIAERKSEEC